MADDVVYKNKESSLIDDIYDALFSTPVTEGDVIDLLTEPTLEGSVFNEPITVDDDSGAVESMWLPGMVDVLQDALSFTDAGDFLALEDAISRKDLLGSVEASIYSALPVISMGIGKIGKGRLDNIIKGTTKADDTAKGALRKVEPAVKVTFSKEGKYLSDKFMKGKK